MPDSPTGSGGGGRRRPATLQIASPDNPVTWPIADDNQPIADGLPPEDGARCALQLRRLHRARGGQGVRGEVRRKVKVSTFNDTDEALTKIRTGAVPFDIYFPSYDQIAQLVTA